MDQVKFSKGSERIATNGMSCDELAEALDNAQKSKHGGRGVGCVREIILYLRRGDIERARLVATHDADKITDASGRFDDIKALIRNELFRGSKEHPWSLLERLQKGE